MSSSPSHISNSPLKQSSSCSAAAQLAAQNSSSSQNITESVPVPSSEHVAEIVGRQGCKIKALRAKTNTYIKTPIRGEAPMFVITGRREDVLTAKREIQLAADHFSQIRARRGSGGAQTNGDGESGKGGGLMIGMSGSTCSGSSSASISPANEMSSSTGLSNILTAKPANITSSIPVVQPVMAVSSILARANSVSPGSSPLSLAPLSLNNSEVFSSHG